MATQEEKPVSLVSLPADLLDTLATYSSPTDLCALGLTCQTLSFCLQRLPHHFKQVAVERWFADVWLSTHVLGRFSSSPLWRSTGGRQTELVRRCLEDFQAREKLRLAAATAREERDARSALMGEPVQQHRCTTTTVAPSTWQLVSSPPPEDAEDDDDLT